MKVKKSALCWLFSTEDGRLSTDRLSRVKGTSSAVLNNKKKNKSRKNTAKIPNNYNDKDVTESEKTTGENTLLQKNINGILIRNEQYYAILYESWYIGRIVQIIDETTSKIKILKSELEEYLWPKKDDIQIVKNKLIFYGPINSIGSGPFKLETNINKICKRLKKHFYEIFK